VPPAPFRRAWRNIENRVAAGPET